jgi:DNA-binding beta-propeller fold protein YncE
VRKSLMILTVMISLALLLAGCSEDPTLPLTDNEKTTERDQPADDKHLGNRASVVVANRASGTISVINARNGELRGTYDLPRDAGDATPEPMYVNQAGRQGHVFVGDRANNRVVAFNARSFEVIGTVPAGQGVFHMWGNRGGGQLWINNDIDNTITVVDPGSLSVLATVEIPADLVAMGGKPHDVVLDPRGRFAYVTILGVSGPDDYLVQFDAQDFTELRRQPVGKDPHVSIGKHTQLFVPCQNSDQVLVFHPWTLDLVDEITVPGAHGAAMARNGRRFYTTNLPGGGAGALYTIDTRRRQIVGGPVDTPYAVPHNLAVSPNGKMLYVTHSGGASDKVTVYRLTGRHHLPQHVGEVTVGLNPFGIGVVY